MMRHLVLIGALALASTASAQSLPNVNGIKQTTNRAVAKNNAHTQAKTNVDSAKMVSLKMPPDPHRSSLCDHVVCGGVWADVQWSADGSQLAFVSTSRDHKQENLRVADAATGTVRDVL